jgi:YidC/Oxa1 family membrane protein insertase
MHFIFNTFFYTPLYNGLILLLDLLPWLGVGVAVILFTCIVKIILFPLSQKSVRTQLEMKNLEPELNAIKLKYKDNKQEQASKTMEIYKQKGINPFSGVILMLIQLPILFALYYIFLRGGLPSIDKTILYPFVKVPDFVNMIFLGIDIAGKSTIFAILAAVAQFFQMQLTMPKTPKKKEGEKEAGFGAELAKSMSFQMKFIMPIMIFFIARSFPVVVSLYLITSSLFAIGQEVYMKSKMAKDKAVAINNIK